MPNAFYHNIRLIRKFSLDKLCIIYSWPEQEYEMVQCRHINNKKTMPNQNK